MDKYTQRDKIKQLPLNKKLSPGAGYVLHMLLQIYRNTGKYPYPSIPTLADRIGAAQEDAAGYVRELQEKGYIECRARHREDGRRDSNEYILLDKALASRYTLKSFNFKSLKAKPKSVKKAPQGDQYAFIQSILVEQCRFNKKMLQDFYRLVGNVYKYPLSHLEKMWKVCRRFLKFVKYLPTYFAKLVTHGELKPEQRRPRPPYGRQKPHIPIIQGDVPMEPINGEQWQQIRSKARLLDAPPPAQGPDMDIDWHPGM